MKTSIYQLFVLLASLWFVQSASAQTSLTNVSPSNLQNFDGMAETTTLPTNWRMHQSASPTWGSGTATLGQQASSDSPNTGGTYNWGTSTSERSAGVMTSGSFSSPNSLMGFYTNAGTTNITSLSIDFDAERYRVNTADASVQFFYSLNGTSWTAVTAGDIASSSFPTGTSSYTFASPLTINKTGITISSLSIAPSSNFYLRWNLNTTGSNSQGIGIDNVNVTATFEEPSGCTAPSTQASNITFSSVTSSSLSLNWTNGNGAGRVIIMNTSNSFTAPTNGSNPSANTTYSGNGEQVVFNGTGSGPITINGLTAGTTYHFRAYEYCSPDRVYQTSTATNNPNNVFVPKPEPSNHATSFACGSTTATSIPLTWTDATGATTPDGYLIKWSATSFAAISAPVDGTAESNGATTQNVAQGVQNLTVSGLTGSTTYFFKIWSYTNSGSNIDYKLVGEPQTSCTTLSNASDIIESPGFTYTFNINYLLNQAAGPFTNTTGSVGVFRFQVRDGGGSNDADSEGTELNSITFSVGTTHINYIQNAGLFDGNTMRANNPTINTGAGTITFSGLSGANFTAPDNSSLTLTLRVSFNNNVADNQQLQFTITNATANAAGSVFAAVNAGGAASSITGDRNRIEVTADRLRFAQQPSSTPVNTGMTPSVVVHAVDVNQILDLDHSGTANITSTGTLTGAPVSQSITAGVATFAGLTHTVVESGRTLTASATGLTDATSNTFDITTIVYNNGDYRTLGSGNWVSNSASPAIWERLVSGVWTPSNSPAFNTSNAIYIQNSHTITTTGSFGNGVSLYVMNNGVFNCNHNGTFANALVYSGGTLNINASFTMASSGTFEVEDNATVNINNAFGTPATSIWNGTEIFHPNSTFKFIDWDAAGDILVPSNTAISTNTYSGYTAAFGNIIFDFQNNLGASDDLIVLESGVNINLAHGNLIFRSNNNVDAVVRLATSGTVTSGIGGNFIVENTYVPTSGVNVINMKTSGTLTFTVNGNMTLGAATTRIFTSTTAGSSSTLVINGNLTLTGNAILDFNSGVAGGSPAPASTMNLKGDLTVSSTSLLQNTNSSSLGNLNFTGTGDAQTIDIATTSANENRYINFNIKNGAYVQLINRNLELGTNSKVVVETGATFDFGFDGTTALNVAISDSQTGTGFQTQQASTLKITSPDGITTTAGVGNVRVVPSNRSYNQVATFHYIGKQNQVTGNAISTASNGKVIICDLINNSTQLTLSNSTGFTNNTAVSATGGKLDIRKGQVIETAEAFVSGSTGTLYMEPGTWYRVVKGSASASDAASDLIPRVVGATFAYVLNGGTIEFAGSGANAFQAVRGTQSRPNFRNLLFSGANTYGTDYKFLSTATAVDSSLRITGTTVVDCINGSGQAASFTGTAGLIMDGGTMRIRNTSNTNPEVTGAAMNYNVTGGTIEFYGSSATQNQRLRGGNTYHNVVVNAEATNLNFGGTLGNMSPTSSVTITGTMQVNAPASLRLDATNSISGSGNFVVNDGATLFYSNANGIRTTGTSASDGHIRVTGTRTFSPNASYGFTSNQAMVTGDGLPSAVENLYMNKPATVGVTLTNSVEVKNQLVFNSGVLVTGANDLFVSNSATSAISGGELTGTDKFVNGRLIRATSNASGYNFPVGMTGYGAQGFNMNITGSGNVLGFMEVNNTAPLQNFAYCDVEIITAPGQTIGQGNPGIDGFLDKIPLDLGSPTQWNITNPGGGVTMYDITMFPNGINDIAPIMTSSGQEMRFLLKNGEPGNTGVPAGDVPNQFTEIGFFACPTVNSLNGLTGFSTFTISGSTGAGSALPIELIFFNATPNQKVVDLTWSTASELNNDFFTVERSIDGLTWEQVLTVNGAGTTNQRTNYRDIDTRPAAGLSYYRLKQTDFDGKWSYSNIQSVFMNNASVELLKVINVLGQEIEQNSKGLVILVFSDGTSLKIINE